jgi:hypothetical protein
VALAKVVPGWRDCTKLGDPQKPGGWGRAGRLLPAVDVTRIRVGVEWFQLVDDDVDRAVPLLHPPYSEDQRSAAYDRAGALVELAVPRSSSISMKVTPLAVSGR